MDMFRQYLYPTLSLSLLMFALAVNFNVSADRHSDDKSDSWESVSQMIKFIEMGDLPSVELAGNKALRSLEKAIDGENDQGKKDKLRDAVSEVRDALGNASKGAWPYAEGAAK